MRIIKSYTEFKLLEQDTINEIKTRSSFNTDKLKFARDHKLLPGEAEAFYESSMSLVVNGLESDEFLDGTHLQPPLPFEVPGYIYSRMRFSDQVFENVPKDQRIDFPLLRYENARICRNYISKDCIDKAILYKRFKDPATIGTPESATSFTGKVETVELDFRNIDEGALQEFIKHGVIRQQEPPLTEQEIAEQIAFAREEAAKSQANYEDYMNSADSR